MSIASEISRLQTAKAGLKIAIEGKGVAVPSATTLDGYPTLVDAIPTGSTAAPFNDVNFYDYDGTIVYSYTKAEFLALNSLPDNPSHNGLTAQGWNWTLSGAKTHVTKYGFLDIGQSYITDNGETRVKISVLTDTEQTFKLYWTQSKSNGVTVDWGDGSQTETVSGSGTGVKNLTHVYTGKGIYTITLMPDDDCNLWLGNKGNYAIWGAGNTNYGWADKIIAVNIGKNYPELGGGPIFGGANVCMEITIPKSCTTINSTIGQALTGKVIILPYGVETVTINSFFGSNGCPRIACCLPETIESIQSDFFRYNSLAKRLCLPDGITTIPSNMCGGCYALQQVNIPEAVTSIGEGAFNNCYALNEVTVPSTVTSIGANVFAYFRGTAIYLLPTTPPTLSNTNAFGNMANTTVIYVPYSQDHSILDAYKTATNWSTYASKMQEMSP